MDNKRTNCKGCHHYKNNMCICSHPEVKNAPFGFPLKYNTNTIKCKSYKKREFQFDWSHM